MDGREGGFPLFLKNNGGCGGTRRAVVVVSFGFIARWAGIFGGVLF
jgi:hypothetical protein